MAAAGTKLTTTSENASDAVLFFTYFMLHLMQILQCLTTEKSYFVF